jgi:hypothetical protein
MALGAGMPRLICPAMSLRKASSTSTRSHG